MKYLGFFPGVVYNKKEGKHVTTQPGMLCISETAIEQGIPMKRMRDAPTCQITREEFVEYMPKVGPLWDGEPESDTHSVFWGKGDDPTHHRTNVFIPDNMRPAGWEDHQA